MVYTLKCKMAETRNDIQSQKKWSDRLTNEDSDVALVRIFECFLEAAPQKILQISIILSGEEDITGKPVFFKSVECNIVNIGLTFQILLQLLKC